MSPRRRGQGIPVILARILIGRILRSLLFARDAEKLWSGRWIWGLSIGSLVPMTRAVEIRAV
jgi:hypothetical protein